MKLFLLIAFYCLSLQQVTADVGLGYEYRPGYNSGSSLLSPPIGSTSLSYGSYANPTAGYISTGYNPGGIYYNTRPGSNQILSTGLGGSGISYNTSPGFTSGTSSITTGYNPGFTSGANTYYNDISSSQGRRPFEAPLVTKNVYYYSAPEDHDNQEVVRQINIGRPQINHKLVFIKAPSSSSNRAKIIANVAPVEDKTSIYLLSKKTNDLALGAEIVTPPPLPPSKPNVVVIKYRTPEEAAHAQHTIQAEYEKLEGPTNYSQEESVPVQSVIGQLGQQSQTSDELGNYGSLNVPSTIIQSSHTPLVSVGHESKYLPPNRKK